MEWRTHLLASWRRLARGGSRQSEIFWFIATGGTATLTHAAAFVAFVEIAKLTPVVASVPSFLIALGVSYCGHRNLTFRSAGSHAVELPKYTVVAVTGLLLNVSITYAIVDVLGAWYPFAILLVVTVVPIATFWASRKWVFTPYTDSQ